MPTIRAVEAQPFKAQAKRVAAALEFLGSPLTDQQRQRLQEANDEADPREATEQLQQIFDERVLAVVNINPESRVKVSTGPASRRLVEQGWTVFLVKVHNQAGVTASLNVSSPHAAPVYKRSTGDKDPEPEIGPSDVLDRWMDVDLFDESPLQPNLSGLEVEYRLLSIYSRDAGKREASLVFDVGQGTQDLGFRNELPVLFECQPAVRVRLDVLDDDGQPTTGQFVFRDASGRVYPARSRRLAPDFFFHDQIYRHSGEEVTLPPGQYEVTYTRGPEYRILKRTITVPDAETHEESFRLVRWIKMADYAWYSGDHHIHAAGCSHYESPTQGVAPPDMMRHILGEDLNVGCVLSWGPCWYYQKDFFDGAIHPLSGPSHLMRYDVEVSGFPSSHAGHLCLLNLKEDDYEYPSPVEFDWSYAAASGHFSGTKTKQVGEWPSWDLPVLAWGKQQGGIVGFSHSGWGLQVPGDELPNYNLPKFDGIGANEYIVDVTHGVCDFISAVDTPSVWELNIWYHTLNCGYDCRISGETDFPCIYGDRVGLGRSYVKLGEDEPLTYESWIEGIRDGRSYCSDGLSHLIDFQVNGLGVGEPGDAGRASYLAVSGGEKLNVTAKVSALLAETPDETIRRRPLDQKPYWHVERARVGNTRRVPVQLVVNGEPVERKEILADGSVQEVAFEYTPDRSSWIALRILPSAHTNPVFVELDGKPIRASRRSAQWCLDAVDICWNAKKEAIYPRERAAAEAAYRQARESYQRILAETLP
ncbi:CehA/McbA family metallohydrolase [Candidatus Laterigemmans baculatus]|uniref:CehA/McbA family metallohydrolase n=1 Tax=Candidatus Laterigemmans baculatus TaxID=2770505 RepID=UPI00193BFAC0|nr:CehA/McbA family metallohydrolase [Candidatus Laterigemmans baculatus]